MTTVETDLNDGIFVPKRSPIVDQEHKGLREQAAVQRFYGHLREHLTLPSMPIVHSDPAGDALAQSFFGPDLYDIAQLGYNPDKTQLWIASNNLFDNPDFLGGIRSTRRAAVATVLGEPGTSGYDPKLEVKTIDFFDSIKYVRFDVEGITTPQDSGFPLTRALFAPRI